MDDIAAETIVRFLGAYNAGAWDELDPLVTPGYRHHNNASVLDLAGFKSGAQWIRAGLPDFHLEIDAIVREGDRAAVRFTGTGTHARSMFGEAPTARVVELHGIAIYRFEDGRIAEDWEAMDEHDLRVQIGAHGGAG
jgi:predicted ester cyclase